MKTISIHLTESQIDFLANDTKLNNLKETSKEHLEDYTQVETDEYGMRYDQNGEEIWTKL